MLQFISGVFFGFFMGISTSYVYRIYKSYKKSGDVSRSILEEVFLMFSLQLFDSVYNTEIKSLELPELPELINISTNILSVSNEYNKSFKYIFQKNNHVIKIIDKEIMNNPKFLNILHFFKNNDIELIISLSESEYLSESEHENLKLE